MAVNALGIDDISIFWWFLRSLVWLIEVDWRIYASVQQAILGSDNGFSPIRRQAIIWTHADLLPIGPRWIIFSEMLIESRIS